jgi:acyl-CoA thioesterase
VPATSPSLFERTVTAHPTGPGRYTAQVEAAWTGPAAPNGGVLAATMLRAAQAELGSAAPPPRSVAVQYLEAPAAREVALAVQVLRQGKRVAVCDVRMRQSERLVAQATIVFSASRPDPVPVRRSGPAPPGPETISELDAGDIPFAPRVFEQLRIWPTEGASLFSGAEHARTGGWMALRDDDAALDAARLTAMCDLWWPAIFPLLRAPAGVPTIQLTVYLRAVEPPVRGPVYGCFETRHVAEGHLEESGELWSADGVLLAESRQLALLIELPG